jgi:tripartite-type tricarboxylate transporter receptor subunit TctC
MRTTIKTTLVFSIAAGSMVATGPTAAQNYPIKPLRIIVASASGGGPDIAARQAANELSLQLGQQVVIDNRPGASGIIGYEMLARAVPDGYTLGYIPFGFATNPSMYSKLTCGSVRDLEHTAGHHGRNRWTDTYRMRQHHRNVSARQVRQDARARRHFAETLARSARSAHHR